jgi:hypothetical protein
VYSLCKLIVDQVSTAIAQSSLLSQASNGTLLESKFNCIYSSLHSAIYTVELQAALKETVEASG